MSEEKKEVPFLIHDGNEYKKEDLTEEQISWALKIRMCNESIGNLQNAYNEYLLKQDYKNMCVKGFESTLKEKKDEKEK